MYKAGRSSDNQLKDAAPQGRDNIDTGIVASFLSIGNEVRKIRWENSELTLFLRFLEVEKPDTPMNAHFGPPNCANMNEARKRARTVLCRRQGYVVTYVSQTRTNGGKQTNVHVRLYSAGAVDSISVLLSFRGIP